MRRRVPTAQRGWGEDTAGYQPEVKAQRVLCNQIYNKTVLAECDLHPDLAMLHAFTLPPPVLLNANTHTHTHPRNTNTPAAWAIQTPVAQRTLDDFRFDETLKHEPRLMQIVSKEIKQSTDKWVLCCVLHKHTVQSHSINQNINKHQQFVGTDLSLSNQCDTLSWIQIWNNCPEQPTQTRRQQKL